MTINKANDLVRGLIGEDDYHHMKGVLAGFYDIAQKQIATTVSPIKKSFSVTCGVQTELPGDLYRLIKFGLQLSAHRRQAYNCSGRRECAASVLCVPVRYKRALRGGYGV